MANNDRYVAKHPDGWAVKKPGSEKASSTHHTQCEAEKRAKEIVGNLGGGEVRIQDRQGAGATLTPYRWAMTRTPRVTKNIRVER